jgi:hypothetical protein
LQLNCAFLGRWLCVVPPMVLLACRGEGCGRERRRLGSVAAFWESDSTKGRHSEAKEAAATNCHNQRREQRQQDPEEHCLSAHGSATQLHTEDG